MWHEKINKTKRRNKKRGKTVAGCLRNTGGLHNFTRAPRAHLLGKNKIKSVCERRRRRKSKNATDDSPAPVLFYILFFYCRRYLLFTAAPSSPRQQVVTFPMENNTAVKNNTEKNQ